MCYTENYQNETNIEPALANKITVKGGAGILKSRAFIKALPKAELHLHLEGAIPWQMAKAYAQEPLVTPPPWWDQNFRFDNFTQFLEIMSLCCRSVLSSVENYHLAAKDIFKRLAAQNVRYVEISFGPELAVTRHLSLSEIVAAIKEAAPESLYVAVFCGLARTQTRDLNDEVMRAVFSTKNLDGLDLHGDESLQDPLPFAQIFERATDRGLAIKAHAGELVGPHSITAALDFLHVNRIEHGTTAFQDEALMDRLAAEEITLDMCPTSNVKLRVVEDIAVHPIRHFHERGIRVTVNTDDPTVFGTTLTGELSLLVDRLQFSLRDIAQLQSNAFHIASMPSNRRDAILTEVERLMGQVTN